jgi:hypothetical protein
MADSGELLGQAAAEGQFDVDVIDFTDVPLSENVGAAVKGSPSTTR